MKVNYIYCESQDSFKAVRVKNTKGEILIIHNITGLYEVTLWSKGRMPSEFICQDLTSLYDLLGFSHGQSEKIHYLLNSCINPEKYSNDLAWFNS